MHYPNSVQLVVLVVVVFVVVFFAVVVFTVVVFTLVVFTVVVFVVVFVAVVFLVFLENKSDRWTVIESMFYYPNSTLWLKIYSTLILSQG